VNCYLEEEHDLSDSIKEYRGIISRENDYDRPNSEAIRRKIIFKYLNGFYYSHWFYKNEFNDIPGYNNYIARSSELLWGADFGLVDCILCNDLGIVQKRNVRGCGFLDIG